MRNTFYGILAIGLLLFLSSNIYANSTTDCKPSVHIQPVKGNFNPLLNGEIEMLEKFLLELAEQDANYCKVTLIIDFKEGLETKQTITHGKPKYNEKLHLEVQYFSPSYEAVIQNAAGDILHKIELGKELKSIEYSNPELNNHDALYAEWRQIQRGNLSQLETDVNNFQGLIDFLKTENGMKVPENPSLAINEKKEILSQKGDVAKVDKKEKSTRKSRRKKAKKKSSSKKKSKESEAMAKAETLPVQKNIVLKVEKESKPKVKAAQEESKEMAKIETPSAQKNSESKVENEFKAATKVVQKESKTTVKVETPPAQKNSSLKVENEFKAVTKVTQKESKEIAKAKVEEAVKSESKSIEKTPSTLEKYSPRTTSIEVVEVNENKPQKSSEPREIISDDEMFENSGVEEPLVEMVQFQFPYGKNYMVVNESDFSIKINTGRESGKIFDDSSIKPKQKKTLKNKFRNGDWYSIVYTEKLHKKDVENYKKSIESTLSDLNLSKLEDDFFKMSEQLIPNLDIISNENPLADKSQKGKVEVRFQRFISEKGIEAFKENQQQEAETQLKNLLTLIVQSHRLHHYYKYTVGTSMAHRPVNKLPWFRKN